MQGACGAAGFSAGRAFSVSSTTAQGQARARGRVRHPPRHPRSPGGLTLKPKVGCRIGAAWQRHLGGEMPLDGTSPSTTMVLLPTLSTKLPVAFGSCNGSRRRVVQVPWALAIRVPRGIEGADRSKCLSLLDTEEMTATALFKFGPVCSICRRLRTRPDVASRPLPLPILWPCLIIGPTKIPHLKQSRVLVSRESGHIGSAQGLRLHAG